MSLLFVLGRYNRLCRKVLSVGDFPPGLIELILWINGGNTQLLANNNLSRQVSILSGVKQGDPLSPTLFILSMQRFLSMLRQHQVESQAYTDDTLVFLQSPQDIDIVSNVIHKYSRTSNNQTLGNALSSFRRTKTDSINTLSPRSTRTDIWVYC